MLYSTEVVFLAFNLFGNFEAGSFYFIVEFGDQVVESESEVLSSVILDFLIIWIMFVNKGLVPKTSSEFSRMALVELTISMKAAPLTLLLRASTSEAIRLLLLSNLVVVYSANSTQALKVLSEASERDWNLAWFSWDKASCC